MESVYLIVTSGKKSGLDESRIISRCIMSPWLFNVFTDEALVLLDFL